MAEITDFKCISEEGYRTFVFRERAAQITVNVNEHPCAKVKVDGVLPISPIKCDWALKSKNNQYMFIELKGSHLVHAFDQIISTIAWFNDNINNFIPHRYSYIVMSGSIPRDNSSIQRRKTKLLDKYRVQCLHLRSGKTKTFPNME